MTHGDDNVSQHAGSSPPVPSLRAQDTASTGDDVDGPESGVGQGRPDRDRTDRDKTGGDSPGGDRTGGDRTDGLGTGEPQGRGASAVSASEESGWGPLNAFAPPSAQRPASFPASAGPHQPTPQPTPQPGPWPGAPTRAGAFAPPSGGFGPPPGAFAPPPGGFAPPPPGGFAPPPGGFAPPSHGPFAGHGGAPVDVLDLGELGTGQRPTPQPPTAEPEPPRPGPLVGWTGDGFPPGDAPAAVVATPARRRSRGLLALLVAGCLLAGLVAGVVGGVVQDRVLTNRAPVTVQSGATTSRPADSIAGVAASVLPSTVSIEVRSATVQGSGSGFVLREDGLILTNNHVIAGGAEGGEIVVVFADGSQEPAEVVGRTSDYDLAVLRVARSGLEALPLGDSDAVVVGDGVIAVGAPLGLEATVTTGIVSALNRPVSAGGASEGAAFINAIQTDAAINPGNSGGPLINLDGEVIGINSAIARAPGTGAGGQGGNIGLGFAIPSAQAARTAQQLIDDGRATYPLVGVLLDRAYSGEGVRVVAESEDPATPAVTPGGPADSAGIRPGDVIVGFEGRPVTEPDQLIVAIRAQEPGDTVTLRVRTGDDAERDVEVVLDEAESDS